LEASARRFRAPPLPPVSSPVRLGSYGPCGLGGEPDRAAASVGGAFVPPLYRLGVGFLPAEPWRGWRNRREIRSFWPSPRAVGLFPGASGKAVKGRPGDPEGTDLAGLLFGAWRRPPFRLAAVKRAASEAAQVWPLRGFRRMALAVDRRWSSRCFYLDLLRRGAPVWSLRSMGIFPGCRRALWKFKVSSPAASVYCDGSKSFQARCFFRTKGSICWFSPSPWSSATDSGEDLQIGLAQFSLRTGLLFAFFSRDLCAKVSGQLSICILLVLALYLYSFSPVFFLTTV
jgi:hypothetical protein